MRCRARIGWGRPTKRNYIALDSSGPLAHPLALWTIENIAFDIIYDETDHPVVTLRVLTPAGPLRFMAEPVMQDMTMLLKGLHAQDLKPNAVGMGKLMVIAREVMERMDFDGLVIKGAVRSTGTYPGHRPRDIRFSRRVRAAHGA
jgi:hypothetical protein